MTTKNKIPDFLKHGEGHCDVSMTPPVAIGGSKVTALRMREPTVRDNLMMEKTSGSEAEQEIALMANLCEITPDEVKGLTLRNYKRLQAAVTSFLD